MLVNHVHQRLYPLGAKSTVDSKHRSAAGPTKSGKNRMGWGVELEWTIEDQGSRPESEGLPSGPAHRRRRVILTLALTLLALVAVVTLALHQRVIQNQRRLRADIQAVVDLEAQAIARGDGELFLSFQNQENADWFEWRKTAFERHVGNALGWPQLKVTDVELAGDYAWVRTVGSGEAGDEQFEWVLFYRRVDDAWRQAAPDMRYWGAERERDIGPLHLVYRERDEPYIQAITAELSKLLISFCGDLGCPADLSLTVQLVLPHPYGCLELATPDVIAIPSLAALPQPTEASPEIPLANFQLNTLAHYLAFEATGGETRWESNLDGAWLVHAAANWAQERLEHGTQGPSWRLHIGQADQLLLRMATRNARLLSLSDLWQDHRFKDLSYTALIQRVSQHVDLDSLQARAVIDYVVEIYGPRAISELLEAMGHHDTLEATLQEALGVGLNEFEAAWLTWMETYYGFGKGWRLANAIIYWEETQYGPLASFVPDDVEYRQQEELMRTAVQDDRVLPLVELWISDKPTASPGGVATLAARISTWPSPSIEYPLFPDAQALEDSTSTRTSATMIVGPAATWRKAHALAVIRYIAQIYDQQAVYDLLPAIVRNDSLDAALRDALGVGLDEFEPAWLAWLQARYGSE